MEKIQYKILSHNISEKLIESFLESASISHKEEIKTKEWFSWKFGSNSFSNTILACALDDEKIIGCVAIGIQHYNNFGKTVKCGMSYDTFVHPKYQGRNIFSHLIKCAENEAKNQGVEVLINLPNKNSLRGFIKSGWNNENIIEYWIKFSNPLKCLLNYKDLKNNFTPLENNFQEIKNSNLILPGEYKPPNNKFEMTITNEYLHWRFFTHPTHNYIIVNDINMYAIGRVGNRGKLSEIQIIYTHPKRGDEISISNLIHLLKNEKDFDLVSMPISVGNRLRRSLKHNFFIKVPGKTNFCYKYLNANTILNFNQLSLSAIVAHTY